MQKFSKLRSRLALSGDASNATEHLGFGNGLNLEVAADGSRLWTLQTAGSSPLIVGTHPDLTVDDARAAGKVLADVLANPGDLPVITPPTIVDRARVADGRTAVTGFQVSERINAARRAFIQASVALSTAGALGTAYADNPPEEEPHELGDEPPAQTTLPLSQGPVASKPPRPTRPKAWIESPKTFGSSSYVRYSPINIVRGSITVELRSTRTLRNVVIKAVGHNGVLAKSPVLTREPFLWTLDTRTLPEGNVVIDADIDHDIPMLHAVVVVDNDNRPVTGTQWIPVGARNTLDEFTQDAWGYEWVKYPATTKGTRLPVRQGIPFSDRKKKTEIWQQAMTSTSLTRFNPSRQFTTLEGGHISIVERQSYTQIDNFRLLVGNCIDGPHGVGRAGSLWNGYVDSKGALVAISGQGRLVRIDLEGTTTTLLGPRLRQGVEPPILLPSATPEQIEWLESFYEHVGVIMDGPAKLNNPWQAVADPRDETMLYIADSDNNRVVVYDTKTKVGRTLCGGVEGFADGLRDTARFNRPRGLAWSKDGNTLYIADDHNSAIRTVNRQGVVSTLVRCARGTNFDLVLQEPFFKKMSEFAGMIRAQMKDGPFGTANFMHPNALAIDSEGNLLAACHHPHVVIKFDLVERRIETLVELPLQSLTIQHLRLGWISLSVDRWGAFGDRDQFAVAYWMQSSYRLYDKEGTPKGYYVGPDKGPSTGFLENGPVSAGKLTSYPAFCAFGSDGSFWHGGSAGDGVYRQTLGRASDPEIDDKLYKRAFELYTKGVPAPMYRRGWRGHSHLGETSFYDFAGKPDSAIAAWIATWPIKYEPDEVAALTYFIRWQA